MTFTDQTFAVGQFGYTPGEASFLVTAALHSGYFVMRQMSPRGGKVADRFARKVIAYGHARSRKYASNTHLFHLPANRSTARWTRRITGTGVPIRRSTFGRSSWDLTTFCSIPASGFFRLRKRSSAFL